MMSNDMCVTWILLKDMNLQWTLNSPQIICFLPKKYRKELEWDQSTNKHDNSFDSI